jgi:hypothetical protein
MDTFDELKQLAQAMHDSRLFRTNSWQGALAVILYGKELGLGPASSLSNISIVSGKPTLGAAAIGGLIQRGNHYDFIVDHLDDEKAVVSFFRQHDPAVPLRPGTGAIGPRTRLGTSTFSMDDAKRAGLGNSPTWRSYPRNLLYARALANGARWYTPSVFAGTLLEPSEAAEIDPDAAPSVPADIPVPDPPMAPVAPTAPESPEGGAAAVNGAAAESTVTLEGLARGFGVDAVLAASGGTLPATDAELRAVAEKLAATVPTVGVAEAAAEEVGDEESSV